MGDTQAHDEHQELSSESLPEHVCKYLELHKQLGEFSKYRKQLNDQLKALKPGVADWLQKKPDFEFDLSLSPAQQAAFGENGKLRFTIDKRKEHINKAFLSNALGTFFNNAFPDKDSDYRQDITEAAVDYIWKSRKTTVEEPVLTRTVSKKRKMF